MFKNWRFDRTRALLLVGLLLPAAGFSAPKNVEAFVQPTWAQLAKPQAGPSAVVFTTTDCAFCPDVIDSLAKSIRPRGRAGARLVVVVMDGAGKSRDLLRNAHYRKADRLFAFEGNELALRHAVNPEWRGLTPYVALVAPSGAVQFVTGPPSLQEVQALLDGRQDSPAKTTP